MGNRTSDDFGYDELLEALDLLWMNMDPLLVEDFRNQFPALDVYLYDRNDDGDRS